MGTEPILFDLPPDEDPEPGVPETITHDCDYMLEPDGKLMFHYNFLSYAWNIAGEEIAGRAYLDEAGTIDVFISNHRLRTDPALMPLVRFLQRRFRQIGTFHTEDVGLSETGYTGAFQHRKAKKLD